MPPEGEKKGIMIIAVATFMLLFCLWVIVPTYLIRRRKWKKYQSIHQLVECRVWQLSLG